MSKKFRWLTGNLSDGIILVLTIFVFAYLFSSAFTESPKSSKPLFYNSWDSFVYDINSTLLGFTRSLFAMTFIIPAAFLIIYIKNWTLYKIDCLRNGDVA